MVNLFNADCLDFLKTLPENSIDSIVTDPPAGISFMGKQWDTNHGGRDQWISVFADVARECLRIIKPGGHALVWAIPRTSHWTATAWENGGWEIRDRIAHLFGSGFPKSHDVGKAIDKNAGAEREVIGQYRARGAARTLTGGNYGGGGNNKAEHDYIVQTAPSTDKAKQWDGWGSALKPAIEDWWLFRKPLTGKIVENVLEWGTGSINIDACRVDGSVKSVPQPAFNSPTGRVYGFQTGEGRSGEFSQSAKGRWPANLIHDGSDEALSVFPVAGKNNSSVRSNGFVDSAVYGDSNKPYHSLRGYNEQAGSASRFFYCAKASRKDRNEGLNGPNTHPTVKNTVLMRYLCRLITPPKGIVLDPFMGSGSTGKAAIMEDFSFIGCEIDEMYFSIAAERIRFAVSNTN